MFSRTYAVFLRQVYLFRSNPTRVTSVLLWLIVDVIQWGFISKYLGTLGGATFGFLAAILGAIILWGFVARVQQGIMTCFLEDVWTQNFVNFFASPLRVVEYLSGLVMTSLATGLFGFVLVVLMAGIAFGYNIFKIGLLLLPFMVILSLFGIAMGIFVSGVIFRLGPSAEWLGWPIPLVLSIFAGVYYPISTLPASLQVVSRVIPVSYVFEGVRAVVGQTQSTMSLGVMVLIGFGLVFLYLAAAYAFFARVYRRNLETGAIARFSAESW